MMHHTPARVALALLFSLAACDSDDTCATSDDCFRGEVCDQTQRRCAPPADMAPDLAADMTPDMAPDMTPDMAPDMAQDMAALTAPADLAVTPTPQGELELTWTAVPGAARYEVRIVAAGEDWQAAGVSPRWLDLAPPPVELAIAGATASDAVHLTHVQLDATASASAPQRRYQVRAIDAAGAPGPESDIVSGQLTAPPPDQLAYQWSVVDGQATTPLAGAVTPSWQDTTAAEAGTPRTYQLSVTAPGGISAEATVTGARKRPAILQLTAGAIANCVLFETGQARCWGGERLDAANPMNVIDPSQAGDINMGGPIKAIARGLLHGCALLQSGEVRCWGGQRLGCLGDPNIPEGGYVSAYGPTPPAVVPLGEPSIAVGAGGFYSCAVGQSGAIRCWGSNINGSLGQPQLSVGGIGDQAGELPPAAITRLEQAGTPFLAERLAMRSGHACATGKIGAQVASYCWGWNDYGQLGTGDKVSYGSPNLWPPPIIAPPGMNDTNPSDIGIGATHTCARLLTSGEVRCWGNGAVGQLGRPSSPAVTIGTHSILRLNGSALLQRADQLSVGANHSCAVMASTKIVRCWGEGTNGKLGVGSTGTWGDEDSEANAEHPTPPLGQPAQAVAAGSEHTCALLADGEVRCWGDNSFGQLGVDPARKAKIGDAPANLPNDPAFNVPLLKK